MIRTFTQNDLIRFIYLETTAEEHREIEQTIATDPLLKEEYDALRDTTEALDNALITPSLFRPSTDEAGKIIV